jgi:flagellar L-ring protein precursor FlgH
VKIKPMLLKLSYVCLGIMLLSACQSTNSHEPLPNDPFYAPIRPEIPQEKVAEDGSIFRPDMANLQENTRATKSSGTSTSKETGVAVNPIIGLGGNALNLGGESIQLGLDTSNDFEGDSSANQSNNLTGAISVTVVQVLANQNLLVRGEKWLTLNNGDEYIRLTGVVRPDDVSPTNEIESTKIANARIQYSGTGSFDRAQKEGWLSGFFSSEYWPF